MGNGCIQVWKTYVLCSFVYEKACECNDLKKLCHGLVIITNSVYMRNFLARIYNPLYALQPYLLRFDLLSIFPL